MNPDLTEEQNNAVNKIRQSTRNLALQLADETPIAKGGGQLYIYRDGSYQPNGEKDLRHRIVHLLGDDWKRHRAAEIIGYLTDSAPQIWETPPLNQINVRNGILDLTTGKLEPHSPAYLSPIQLAVTYNPDADCPQIRQFLEDTLDPEVITVFFELVGLLTVPDNRLQKAVTFLGGGANGKSTALGVLTALLGRNNISNVPLHRLDDDKFATANLYGKLANIFADLDHRALQSSSIFKSITGGDDIQAERKRQDAFSFTPFCRLIFSTNEPPPTPDGSDAFFRRWLTIPFTRRFTGENADPNLLAKLTTAEELSGLLNQGLARLAALRRRGDFTATTATTEAAKRFRIDSDSVAGFVAEACTITTDGRTVRAKLYPAYAQWCKDANRGALSRQRFNRRLEELVPTLTVTKIQGVRYWNGLTLEDTQ